MLHQISWKILLLFLLATSSLYYLCILALYYRRDILGRSGPGRPFVSEAGQQYGRPDDFNDLHLIPGLLSQVHELVEEIRQLLQQASAGIPAKMELLGSLQSLLRNYPLIMGSSLRQEVGSHVAAELMRYCSISLSEEEQINLWKS